MKWINIQGLVMFSRKENFLFGFWKKHGEDTPDQTGISYNEYMKRVQESNDKFGHLKLKAGQPTGAEY